MQINHLRGCVKFLETKICSVSSFVSTVVDGFLFRLVGKLICFLQKDGICNLLSLFTIFILARDSSNHLYFQPYYTKQRVAISNHTATITLNYDAFWPPFPSPTTVLRSNFFFSKNDQISRSDRDGSSSNMHIVVVSLIALPFSVGSTPLNAEHCLPVRCLYVRIVLLYGTNQSIQKKLKCFSTASVTSHVQDIPAGNVTKSPVPNVTGCRPSVGVTVTFPFNK